MRRLPAHRGDHRSPHPRRSSSVTLSTMSTFRWLRPVRGPSAPQPRAWRSPALAAFGEPNAAYGASWARAMPSQQRHTAAARGRDRCPCRRPAGSASTSAEYTDAVRSCSRRRARTHLPFPVRRPSDATSAPDSVMPVTRAAPSTARRGDQRRSYAGDSGAAGRSTAGSPARPLESRRGRRSSPLTTANRPRPGHPSAPAAGEPRQPPSTPASDPPTTAPPAP